MRKQLILGTTIVLLAQGCSFKSNSGSQTIQIALPQQSHSNDQKQVPFDLSALLKTPVHDRDQSNPQPATFSDLNCFAVNVTGPGIAPDPQVNCGNGPGIGIVAGFVPSSAGSITLSIPNGPARAIQLVGVDSSVGCPDLNTLFSSQNSHAFNGISNPYQLGQTQVDVESDMTININANFVATSQPVFQTCGIGSQGPSYGPTTAYAGHYVATNSAVGPFDTVTPDSAPSSTPSGDILGATTIQTSSLPINNNGTPPLTQGISSCTTSNPADCTTALSFGQRAMMQLQWDVTSLGLDLTTYPYGSIQMQFRGGQMDNCAMSNLFGASAQVWNPVAPTWMAIGGGTYQFNNTNANGQSPPPNWFSSNAPFNVPLQQLLFTKADGHQYILVNVESNFSSYGNCGSAVYVASSALQLSKTFAGASNSGGQLQLSSLGLPGGGSGIQTYQVAEGGSPLSLFATGGTPPYSYTLQSSPLGTIDSNTGIYTPSSTPGLDTVTVTDSSSPAQSTSVGIRSVLPTAAVGVAFLPDPLQSLPPNFQAGTCLTLDMIVLGINGTNPSTSGSVTYFDPSNSSNFFSTATCISGGSSGGSVSSPTTTLYYKVTQAGLPYVYANIPSISNGVPSFSTYLNISTTPLAFSQVTMKSPVNIDPNVCTPVTFLTTDTYGNMVAPPAGPDLIIVAGLAAGGFWEDSGCSAIAIGSTFSFAAGQTSYPQYFKANTYTTGPFSVISGSSVTDENNTPTSPSTVATTPSATSILSTDSPVGLLLALDSISSSGWDSQGCVVIDITSVESDGTTPADVTSGLSLTLTFSDSSQVYPATSAAQALSDCDNIVGQSSPTIAGSSSSLFVGFKPGTHGNTGNVTASGFSASNTISLP